MREPRRVYTNTRAVLIVHTLHCYLALWHVCRQRHQRYYGFSTYRMLPRRIRADRVTTRRLFFDDAVKAP